MSQGRGGVVHLAFWFTVLQLIKSASADLRLSSRFNPTGFPWLRGLVSPSKAMYLQDPQLETPGDPLPAFTVAFPSWLATIEGIYPNLLMPRQAAL